MKTIKYAFLSPGNIFRYSVLFFLAIMTACNGNEKKSDAYGNFEAEEIVVSAENNGQIIEFEVNEGEQLEKGQQIALIDTTFSVLNLQQLKASLRSAEARAVQLNRTIEVQETRLEVLQKEVVRVKNLRDEEAIPTQKFDEVTGQYEIALKELGKIRSQQPAIEAETELVKVKIETAREQLRRCRVEAPVAGTVLQKYAEKGELAAPGKPLLKLAETRELILRAYVSGSQLDDVKIGQQVTVRFDKTKETEHETTGTISWVSPSAEFTPKIIQTKEERVDLVYAIKVRVPNADGRIKIGMPGEVVLKN